MSRISSRRAAIALCLASLATLLAACGSTSTAPTHLITVTLALDWTPNTNHTGIYVAQQKGWYREQGIDLKFTPYSNAVAPEQLVSTGKADFGISFTEGVTAANATQASVVSVAAILQHNTSALVTLKSSGLDSLVKLQGKRYAGFGAPYEQPIIEQMLRCAGVKAPDFKNVATDQDPIVALKSKQFDFAWIYLGWEGIEAQRQHVDLNVFPLRTNCMPDYYSPVIITSPRESPDVARRFLAATSKGYTYATQHPDEAGRLLIQGAPQGTFDDEGLVTASQAYLSPLYSEGAKCWGLQTLANWTNYPRFMFEHQAILDENGKPTTTPPNYAAAFTNADLPSCE